MEQIVKCITKKSIENQDLVDFLKQTFENLTCEFELYLTNIPEPEDIFNAGERTLLGLFNNAIVRNSEDCQTYQEYSVVKKGEGSVGRADMFVITPKFNILIEAKKWESKTLDFSSRKLSRLLTDVWEQGRAYYNAEITKLEVNPYLMTLVFDWYRRKRSDDTSLITEYEIEKRRDGIHYYSVYYLSHLEQSDKNKMEIFDDYLMVYGKIC